jgi:ferredoxin-nitrite reductase
MSQTVTLPADAPFTDEQKEYIAGYLTGVTARRIVPFAGHLGDGRITHDASDGAANLAAPPAEELTAFGVPIDELSKEERLKLEENPLDIWDKILAHAAADKPPEGGDIFRFKFHGLFYVAPNQESLMLRARVPGGTLATRQLRGLAAIARDLGGGYGDITTRANLQLREFPPRNIAKVMMAVADLGMTSRGAGADNIRNITATPTSGIDPEELYDVRPLVKALQYYIGSCRDLYGLPRKFNIAFDTGGAVSTVSDTNDIGFVATRVGEDAGVEPGIYFRVLLAGITGHKRFAMDSGLLLKPEECVAVAAALVRVFNETGDRTDRKKARLCYAIERIGIDGFLARTEEKLAFPLRRLPAEECQPPRPITRHGYLGIHRQSQPGLFYVGVRVPVGRMTAAQMDAIADIMETCGDGECRLTVWQNLILSGIREEKLAEVEERLAAMGYATSASSVTGGLVACTGNTGCRFSSTNTKGQALALGTYLDERLILDRPINIHLTGCPNSCAQHYIGDIGLLGTMVDTPAGPVEGYHVYVGGGSDHERELAREFAKAVPFDDLPPLLERLFGAYLGRRRDGEGFLDFARRHEIAELTAMTMVDA